MARPVAASAGGDRTLVQLGITGAGDTPAQGDVRGGALALDRAHRDVAPK